MEVMKVIPFSGCLHIWISLWQWQRLERIMCSVKCYWLIFKTLEYCTNISSVCAAQYEIAILPMNCGPGMNCLEWDIGCLEFQELTGMSSSKPYFFQWGQKQSPGYSLFFFFSFIKKWCDAQITNNLTQHQA